MSDASQGEGWWQASDGKWYPPSEPPGDGYWQADDGKWYPPDSAGPPSAFSIDATSETAEPLVRAYQAEPGRKIPVMRTQADLDRANRNKKRPSPEELRILSDYLDNDILLSPPEQAAILMQARDMTAELAKLSATEINSIHPNTGKGWLLESVAAAKAGVLYEYDLFMNKGMRAGHPSGGEVLQASFAAAEAIYTLGGGWESQASDGIGHPPEPARPVPPPPAAGPIAPLHANELHPRVVSLVGRLGGYLLNGLLALVTLFIGWLVWAIVLAAQGRGQTPAKQLLGHKVVVESTGETAGFLRMFFGRGLVPALIFFLAFMLFIIPGVILLFLPLFNDRNKTLWEQVSDTLVVYD